jgi:hypothetical protein
MTLNYKKNYYNSGAGETTRYEDICGAGDTSRDDNCGAGETPDNDDNSGAGETSRDDNNDKECILFVADSKILH